MEIIYFLDAQEAKCINQHQDRPIYAHTFFVTMPVSSKDTRFKAH